jgi:predicted Na+-dependent transporter
MMIAVFAQQVGVPAGKGGAFISIALWTILPFAVGNAAAWLFRRSLVTSLVMFASIVAVAVYQFYGLYRAFFRAPAEGGLTVIYVALQTSAFMTVVATVAAVTAIGYRLKRPPNKAAEPSRATDTPPAGTGDRASGAPGSP